MEQIYECIKCGAHHRSSDWSDTTSKISQISSQDFTIHYCPTCEQASTSQEIDIMTKLFDTRFWPYYIDKNDVFDRYPEMSKWLI